MMDHPTHAGSGTHWHILTAVIVGALLLATMPASAQDTIDNGTPVIANESSASEVEAGLVVIEFPTPAVPTVDAIPQTQIDAITVDNQHDTAGQSLNSAPTATTAPNTPATAPSSVSAADDTPGIVATTMAITPGPSATPSPVPTPVPLSLSITSAGNLTFGDLPGSASFGDAPIVRSIPHAFTVEVTGPADGWVVMCSLSVTSGKLPASAVSWQHDTPDGAWVAFDDRPEPCSERRTDEHAVFDFSLRLNVPAGTSPGPFTFRLGFEVVAASGE